MEYEWSRREYEEEIEALRRELNAVRNEIANRAYFEEGYRQELTKYKKGLEAGLRRVSRAIAALANCKKN